MSADFLVTAHWKDDNARLATTRQYLHMSTQDPVGDAAEDFFDALQAASSGTLLSYGVVKPLAIASPTAAVASPYSVSDRIVLAFRTAGRETMRYSVPCPKNAVMLEDESVDLEHAGIAALIAWVKINSKSISGAAWTACTGGWRTR